MPEIDRIFQWIIRKIRLFIFKLLYSNLYVSKQYSGYYYNQRSKNPDKNPMSGVFIRHSTLTSLLLQRLEKFLGAGHEQLTILIGPLWGISDFKFRIHIKYTRRSLASLGTRSKFVKNSIYIILLSVFVCLPQEASHCSAPYLNSRTMDGHTTDTGRTGFPEDFQRPKNS